MAIAWELENLLVVMEKLALLNIMTRLRMINEVRAMKGQLFE